MDSLTLLTTRKSNKKLTAPAPSAAQLEVMFQAALRAPDHGKLCPYRFVVIEGTQAQNALAQALERAVSELHLGEDKLAKAQNLATRAPMVIAVIACLDDSIAKVPVWEQKITAGCAAYAIQLAANAQGFDNVWITARWVESQAVRQLFDCQPNEQIIALLQIGSAQDASERTPKTLNSADFVRYL